MIDSKEKQQSPQKCPKCSNTENLTVAVTCVPDRESTWGGRVVWDNNTATTCGACGFIGKVADFEPKDSYGPEHEEAWEEIARGDEQYLPARCRQIWGDPIEDETEIKRITDALLKAYPPRGLDKRAEGFARPGERGGDGKEGLRHVRLRYRRGTAQGGGFSGGDPAQEYDRGFIV